MQCSKKAELLQILCNTIEKHNMLSKGDSVLIGVSGGADSVCLLHSLWSIKDKLGIRIYAAHLNHGIRGEEAQKDAEYVKKLCNQLDVELFYKFIKVEDLAKEENVSVETAGRLARYRFFKEVCIEKKIKKIATAHNKNDQAETVLMRILRGTGIDGMSGIQYCREDGVIRPLLDTERSLIEEYCREEELDYCIDSTNTENDYTRNKIRNVLIPYLKEEYNPNITNALANMAETMAEDSEFINGYSKRLYNRINNPAPASKPVVLDIESLKMVDCSIQKRLIRLAVKDAMGKKYSLDKCHIDSVLGLLDKETGVGTELPMGLRATVRYGWIAFETPQEVERLKSIPMFSDGLHYNLEIGKKYDIDEYSVSFDLVDLPAKAEKNQMIIDYDKVSGLELKVRTRERGDIISLFKDGKSKKLKDFMIDKKIPLSKRGKIPLLCSNNEVIAVIGERIAEPYKTDGNSKRGLRVTYDKNEDR